MDQNEVTKHFSVGNTFRQDNDGRSDFLYMLHDDNVVISLPLATRPPQVWPTHCAFPLTNADLKLPSSQVWQTGSGTRSPPHGTGHAENVVATGELN